MNYFPGNTQKNSRNKVLLFCRSTCSECKDVQRHERSLLLPWRNLPSPPQGRNRETKEEGERERQPTVGNSLFFQHKHISAVITSKQPERERAWCLPGMDHDRVREYCLSHFIHSLNLMFDIWKMHMHINPCKQLKTAELWTCTL